MYRTEQIKRGQGTLTESRLLQRVINRLNAMYRTLPEGEDKGAKHLQGEYNQLVSRAESLTGEDLQEFQASDDLVLSLGEFLGIGHDSSLPQKYLDLRAFRPLIAGLIDELKSYDEMPRDEPTPKADAQVVVNVATGETVAISTAGRDSTQRVEVQVQPRDTDSLYQALRQVGVSEDRITDLAQRIEEGGSAHGEQRRVAWEWFGDFVTDVASGAVGGSVANSVPLIAGAITAFVG